MKIIYSSKFCKNYKKLNLSIKKTAEQNEKIFINNPFDNRLRTHKLKGRLENYWSFSIGYKYRIVFRFIDQITVFFVTVGKHDIYN
ncbi:MAG: type II toxin-antitoxin system mRNA interferase toxin, RelE/StbE family [Candidatus Komeilibacteria bacterium CG10_big_fil_rev_8_21_14_0_10_41_13]|uniref:Type II toxin-antitoxin system mRNA interferase toxin, RelE/StbE family n=1 Tax=Candidatus Komeilibacteria bacterium CG10_big_fil_rev_8_21_14_0_10_41_13 TaxID=1974476 RepID=A0A2M6WC49_9BACT|nr:MAG: type II toxin-antitoxin system mRNA interferase toxin, RelE/StbE family [Candidatus Komeilibacteria bacterium CG10_big_fil_rev_8_21_14_0_10_41_13]